MRNPSQSRSRNLERLKSRSPEHTIAYLLKSLQHSLRQAVDERLRKEGISVSFAHFTVLFSLEETPGLSGAELARRTFVTAQTMNTILHRLAREGRVERRPHPERPRTDSWFITRKGQGQLEKAVVVGAAIWRSMLSTLGPRELKQMQNYLERCLVGINGEVAQLAAEGERKAVRKKAGVGKAGRQTGRKKLTVDS